MSDTAKTTLMHRALRARHENAAGNGNSAAWIYADEVRVSTGFGAMESWYRKIDGGQYPEELRGAFEQRIDAYALHTWPSKRGLRIAYEIKASTADLKKELADHGKSAAARFLSNEFYIVAHADVLLLSKDVPEEWGIMRCSPDGVLRTARKAIHQDNPLPPFSFMVSLARNVQKRARWSPA